MYWHESRSHGNEREAERARKQGARPTPLGARPPLLANQHESQGLCSIDSKDRGKSHDEGRFDRMVENNMEIPWELLFLDFLGATLPGLYKQTPTSPWRHTSSTESKLGFQVFIQVERIPLVLLVLPLVHLDLVLVHLVLVLVPLVLVLVSSSCNLENREREEESGGGAGSVGSSSTLYFCSNWFVLHRSPGSSIHNSWVL